MASRVAATEAPPELRFACPTLHSGEKYWLIWSSWSGAFHRPDREAAGRKPRLLQQWLPWAVPLTTSLSNLHSIGRCCECSHRRRGQQVGDGHITGRDGRHTSLHNPSCLASRLIGIHRLDFSRLATYWLHLGPAVGRRRRCQEKRKTTQVSAWSEVAKRRARGSNPQPHYWGTTFPVFLPSDVTLCLPKSYAVTSGCGAESGDVESASTCIARHRRCHVSTCIPNDGTVVSLTSAVRAAGTPKYTRK